MYFLHKAKIVFTKFAAVNHLKVLYTYRICVWQALQIATLGPG